MSKSLKILALASWYPNEKDPQQGIFIKHQLEAIGNQHKVDLHTLHESKIHSETRMHKIEGFTHFEHFYSTPNGVFKQLNWYRRWLSIINTLQKGEYDLLHVHVAYPIGIIALKVQNKLDIPLLVSEHWSGYNNSIEYSGPLRKLITAKLMNTASEIIVQSEFLKTIMTQNRLLGSYNVIPNIVHFTESLDSKNHLNSDKIFMNIADHVDSDKNISGLLKSFAKASESNKNIHLLQIGNGPDEERLKKLATDLNLNDRITWLGRLSNEKVLIQIHKCDYGIINSNQETFSVVTFEFLASKKPIIITDCGGPIEYLHKGFGIKTAVGNEEKLSEAILEMAEQKENFEMDDLAQQVRQQFSAKSFIEKINIVYQNALSQ